MFVGNVQENDKWIADLRKWREYVENADHDLEGTCCTCLQASDLAWHDLFVAYVNAVESLVQDKMVKLTEVSSK